MQNIVYTPSELKELYLLCQTISNSRKKLVIGEYIEIVKLFIEKKITNEHSCVTILKDFNELSV